MQGSGWCGQILKVEEPNSFMHHCFIFSLFSGVQSNGSSVGLSGTGWRRGQLQVWLLKGELPGSSDTEWMFAPEISEGC